MDRSAPRMHPANLALRFLLEILALVGVGVGTWSGATGAWRYAAVVGGLGIVILAWGLFRVPGDPSSGRNTPVPISGSLRILIETAVFSAGALGYASAGWTPWAVGLGIATAIHYGMSHKRIRWLLTRHFPKPSSAA